MIDDPPTFVCVDCDCDVYVWGYCPTPTPARCSTCQWIADVPDPAERVEQIRTWLKEIEASPGLYREAKGPRP
jgi:hypothetical protein